MVVSEPLRLEWFSLLCKRLVAMILYSWTFSIGILLESTIDFASQQFELMSLFPRQPISLGRCPQDQSSVQTNEVGDVTCKEVYCINNAPHERYSLADHSPIKGALFCHTCDRMGSPVLWLCWGSKVGRHIKWNDWHSTCHWWRFWLILRKCIDLAHLRCHSLDVELSHWRRWNHGWLSAATLFGVMKHLAIPRLFGASNLHLLWCGSGGFGGMESCQVSQAPRLKLPQCQWHGLCWWVGTQT